MKRGSETFFTQCMRKANELTRRGGYWPLDGGLWHAGSPAAWEQLKDMARVYIADVRRPDDHPQRIWPREEARHLLIHLCEAIIDASDLYEDNRWCHTLLEEVNPT